MTRKELHDALWGIRERVLKLNQEETELRDKLRQVEEKTLGAKREFNMLLDSRYGHSALGGLIAITDKHFISRLYSAKYGGVKLGRFQRVLGWLLQTMDKIKKDSLKMLTDPKQGAVIKEFIETYKEEEDVGHIPDNRTG